MIYHTPCIILCTYYTYTCTSVYICTCMAGAKLLKIDQASGRLISVEIWWYPLVPCWAFCLESGHAPSFEDWLSSVCPFHLFAWVPHPLHCCACSGCLLLPIRFAAVRIRVGCLCMGYLRCATCSSFVFSAPWYSTQLLPWHVHVFCVLPVASVSTSIITQWL